MRQNRSGDRLATVKDCSTGPTTALSELWIHYIWWENRFKDSALYTVNGNRLRIVFPGWYNRGWGPDFLEAKVCVDDVELFGSIEIHLDESAWLDHNHDRNDAYNNVVLHVFLVERPNRVKNALGQEIHALNLTPFCAELVDQNDSLPKVPSDDIPGACGLLLRSTRYSRIKALIFQAAETRVLEKANRLSDELECHSDIALEQKLFVKISRAMGYTALADSFEHLANQFPYKRMIAFYRSSHRQKRVEVLGRWFGYLGIFEKYDTSTIPSDHKREWLSMIHLWRGIQKDKDFHHKEKSPSRPLNQPSRRLLGLFYHLDKVSFDGLLKSWLKFILDCGDLLSKEKSPRPKILHLLDRMFPQPEWELLVNSLALTGRQKLRTNHRLIGKERQLAIVVNAVIPLFIVWADTNETEEIKRILFKLLLVLPPESTNHKTRFMEKRLFCCHPDFKMKKSLSYHQGLIQLYDDCCASFYEGCENCSLITLLDPAVR